MRKVSDLTNQSEIMQLLFDVMPHIFWKERRTGRYLGANLNEAKTFGLNSTEEFIGKTIYEIVDNEEQAKLIEETDNKVMDSKKMIVIEETLNTPNGVKRYLSYKHPIFDNKGDVVGMLGYAMDITDI
jgi:two-component system aerobic respiration control sensor histidine kinase ArcB